MRFAYYIIKSFVHFTLQVFSKKKVDVVFYYPQHFNKSKEGNIPFFEQLTSSCKDNGLSYVLFEEPDINVSNHRNNQAIPFDFPWLLVLFLRKALSLVSKQKIREREQKIGEILKKTIFRNFYFENYVVLSQSMLGVFRGLGPTAKLFELQHGIIHAKKESYIHAEAVAQTIADNQVNLLFSGTGFQSALASANSYYAKHAAVIGSHKVTISKPFTTFNGNILISLQFTRDHSLELNQELFKNLQQFLQEYAATDWTFYLKNHPRFNNEVPVDKLLQQQNVREAPELLSECFECCSMHVTAYSTTSFEAASLGIPTCFLSVNGGHDYFRKDFDYPFIDKTLEELVDSYTDLAEPLKDWYANFYDSFSESAFLRALNKA